MPSERKENHHSKIPKSQENGKRSDIAPKNSGYDIGKASGLSIKDESGTRPASEKED